MHLSRIAEFFFGGGGGGGLNELAEARPGIRETPRRQFDPESLEGIKYFFVRGCIHSETSLVGDLDRKRRSQSLHLKVTDFFWETHSFA